MKDNSTMHPIFGENSPMGYPCETALFPVSLVIQG